VPRFTHDGLDLHYSERGDPDGPPVVLVHGLLWSSRMFRRVAAQLADHRVLLIDVRGHLPSDRPTDPAAYSWATLAGDVVGLLDHLGLERAVVGGLSLGANVALAAGNEHADRVAGLVVEMPVLDRSEPFARRVFTALAATLDTVAPVLGPVGRAVPGVPVPRGIPELAAVRDVLSLDPRAGAALIRGLLDDQLLLGDLRPDVLTMPTLVIGHRSDPLHALADARALVELLPDARLVERHSILDYRVLAAAYGRELDRFLREI
jgi:pimeloyl-ACP methyl ester carboxylesterase